MSALAKDIEIYFSGEEDRSEAIGVLKESKDRGEDERGGDQVFLSKVFTKATY